MMKSMYKIISLILGLSLCIVLLPTGAMAQDSASTSGSGNTSSYFWVDANGNASITFTQTEGTCTELSYTHLIDGILGQEEEWGKYHIFMTCGSTTQIRDWDKTFNGDNFTVYLPHSGIWRIEVIPYTAQEMTDSWTLDTFVEWTSAPIWWISGTNNCSVDTQEPGSSSSHNPVPNPQVPSVWDYPNTGYTVWLKDPYVERIRPQCGPGNEYKVFSSMSGSTSLYKPSQIDWMEARFVSGNWVYVEFSYAGNSRGGWFQQNLFNCSVPWTSIISFDMYSGGLYGTTVKSVTPYNGPGYNYGDYPSCSLSSGESIYALMEYNGWYYCRFYNNHSNNYGQIWLWVPTSSVRLN